MILLFRITTTGPSPSIKLALSHPGTGILPKAYVEQALSTGDWSNPVCSGPFKLEERKVGESVKVVKNDTYADPNTQAQCNSLTFRYVPEASSRTVLVETGEADVNFSFATADYDRASKDSNLKIHEHSGTVTQYIGVDTTMAPLEVDSTMVVSSNRSTSSTPDTVRLFRSSITTWWGADRPPSYAMEPSPLSR